MPRTYTTKEVADAIGVAKMTLLRWIWAGKIREPRRASLDGVRYRFWTKRELEAAREYRERFYGAGRGRKKKRA